MDTFVGHYLETLEQEMASVAERADEMAGHVVAPFDTTCFQGSFRYTARALAQRGETVLFIAYDTQQYGVGQWEPIEGGRVVGADQYLTPEAAVRRFLAL